MYTSVTEQIADIRLDPPPARKKRIENPVSVVVLSKGIFKSKAIVIFPADFEDAVVHTMSDGVELEQEEKDAYFKEYLNIFFGRFISVINNEIGKASRFVIPVLLRGAYRESGATLYKNKVDISFMAEQGRIQIILSYDVLPEYSSN